MSTPSSHRVPVAAERTFLLGALGLTPAPGVERELANAEVERELASGKIDWSFLLPYAREHLVLPALGRALRAAEGFRDLPRSVRESLTDALVQNEIQNRVLLFDLAAAVRALEAAGIESIAIKGAALMARLPDLVVARHTDDIDLWVDPHRIHEADRVLRASGYRDAGPFASASPDHDGTYPSQAPSVAHHLPVLMSERGTPLEVHRYPPAAGKSERGRWADAFARAERVDVGGVRVVIRDAASTLRDLCGHVVLTHHSHPPLWARHLLDVAALTRGRAELFAEAASRASLANRCALRATRVVSDQIRKAGEGPIARRCVFPSTGHFAWGWDRVLFQAAAYSQVGPGALARAIWPSPAFLEARGFDPRRGRLHARLARMRSLLTPPGAR